MAAENKKSMEDDKVVKSIVGNYLKTSGSSIAKEFMEEHDVKERAMVLLVTNLHGPIAWLSEVFLEELCQRFHNSSTSV